MRRRWNWHASNPLTTAGGDAIIGKRVQGTTVTTIRPEQRFTVSSPCPICCGHADMTRGVGERCAGFVSGRYAYCERVEKSGVQGDDNATDVATPTSGDR